MGSKVYKNCPITQSDVKVIRGYDKENHPWIDLEGYHIYSPCYALAIADYVYRMENRYAIVLQYNAIIYLRFSNLVTNYIEAPSNITPGTVLGNCDKFVSVELLMPKLDIPVFSDAPITPIVNPLDSSMTLYRVNPSYILDGTIPFENPKGLANEGDKG